MLPEFLFQLEVLIRSHCKTTKINNCFILLYDTNWTVLVKIQKRRLSNP